MSETLVIPGISEESGFEEINKEEWMPILVEGETILLANVDDETKKIWLMLEEWTRTAPKEEPVKKIVQESISINQTAPEETVQGGVSEKEPYEVVDGVYTLESLKQMRMDELIFLAMIEYGEEKIKEKLYCLFGHCQSGCKSCNKG